MLNGPRRAGKTTLVRHQLPEQLRGTFVTLDDEDELAACLADPLTVLDRPRPVVVDEFQRAGDRLLRTVKLLADRDPAPGQFLLTGSTRFLTVPTISESLAGRVHIVDLWPLSQGEADGLGPDGDSLLPRLLSGEPIAPTLPQTGLPTRTEYLRRLCRGGYPEVQRMSGTTRRRFFRNYVRTVTQRDVPSISRIRHVDELPRLLRALAGSTGQEVKDTELAKRVTIDRRTLRANYLPLLQTVYLTVELPAWSRNLVTRVSKQAKTHLVDTGLAAHLLGLGPDRLAEPTCPGTGPLVETFVANELLRQVSRYGDEFGATLYHYRAHTGTEIDLVVETDDGCVGAIEVKAGASVREKDFAHLTAVRDRLDDLQDARYLRGVVLYTGDRAYGFGDRLEALPLASLWLPPEA